MNVTPYPGTNQQIEKIAEKLRLSVTDPEDLDCSSACLLRNFIDQTGGTIYVVEDPSEQEVDGGSLVIYGEKNYEIFLSPYTTPLRDNFTLAHELGHYVLHFWSRTPRPHTPLSFARYGTGLIEWQANRFAAAWLMPEREFTELYQATQDLMFLSGFFDVSLPAVEVRVKSLGLDVGDRGNVD